MQITVEHKYSIGDFVYAAELKDDDIGINIVKYRITGARIISHQINYKSLYYENF